MSEHQVFKIIKGITSAEKAYFKKYAFKRQNKGNDNYRILFDLLNNSDSYDAKKIQAHKKLDSTFKKNIAVSLNQLQSKLIRTLLEYRDSRGKYLMLNAIKEVELYAELGLNELAKKTVVKAMAHANKDNRKFFKPYLHQKMLLLTAKKATSERVDLNFHVKELKGSISALELVVDLNSYGYELETLIIENGGMILKDSSFIEKTKSQIKTGYQLANHPAMNMHYLGALVSNLLLLELMVGKFEGFDKLIGIFIAQFDEQVNTDLDDLQLVDISLVIKNLAVLTLHFNSGENYDRLITRIDQLLGKASNRETKQNILLGKYQAEALNCVLNDLPFTGEMEERIIARFKEVDNTDPLKAEFLIVLLILQIRHSRFQEAIDLSNDLLNEKSNSRFNDDLIIIKLLVGIAWYKLENIDLSESYIRSAYRSLMKEEQFVLREPLVKLLRALRSGRTLHEDFLSLARTANAEVEGNGTGFEKTSAQTLMKIAELAFEKIA